MDKGYPQEKDATQCTKFDNKKRLQMKSCPTLFAFTSLIKGCPIPNQFKNPRRFNDSQIFELISIL